jgi:predicted transcriptional regulator
MTKTLNIRLPAALTREFKVMTKAAKTSPTAVLRRAAANYVRRRNTGPGPNAI